MKNIRFQLLEDIINRDIVKSDIPQKNISEYFKENVFDKDKMKKFLSEDAYIGVMNSIKKGEKISREIADQVASSMKAWAMSKGAKSFTHWFQPLTGATAEKHDTFFVPSGEGSGLEAFSGDSLVQQEPDASSFPNGGIRETFEARGYTAWDPSSPAFIMENGQGKTLCIPTIFISYTGEALDFKAPLLKSSHFLEEAVLPVVKMFDRHATRVTTTLGWEQEYFLVDEALYFARPDLVMTGRAVLGHSPAKGQQLDDHYFGSIPDRVYAYMLDFEKESHKLGIPIRTRHNEVAPSQYECAPMFEEVNVAIDHNQLLMDVMERVAKRHKLRVLFHEKPYAGINGSGKHNNWSMSTDTGKNLLSPGKTPRTNLLFLTTFINVIKAVHDHNDLIRASIASAGNDHRLGANEAPPAIISVFIGSHLTSVLKEIEKRVQKGDKLTEDSMSNLKLDIHNQIPDVLLDNTDRNRTSPFAFTGNKFEVRAVGSTTNCASPMIVLNTMVGNQFKQFKKDVDDLMKKNNEKKEAAILRVLKKYITQSKNILFEGDNYSDEWVKEAAKRKLKNIKTTPHALDLYITKSSKDLFIKNEIFTDTELEARYEVLNEDYSMKMQIEARVIGDLATNHVLPVAVEYQNRLIENVRGLKELKVPAKLYQQQIESIKKISERINGIQINVKAMVNERKKINKIESSSKKAKMYCEKVVPYFDKIRYHCDKLEERIDDNLWPLPKYRELLFIR